MNCHYLTWEDSFGITTIGPVHISSLRKLYNILKTCPDVNAVDIFEETGIYHEEENPIVASWGKFT